MSRNGVLENRVQIVDQRLRAELIEFRLRALRSIYGLRRNRNIYTVAVPGAGMKSGLRSWRCPNHGALRLDRARSLLAPHFHVKAEQMLDWFRYRYELWQLQRQNRKEIKPRSHAYSEAQKTNISHDKLVELGQNLFDQMEINRDKIALLKTRYLTSQADKHLVPIPEMSDADILGQYDPLSKWRRSKHDVFLRLTDNGIRELRLALRADRRERLEIIRSWTTTIISSLTGLIGVLIGLAAVILGRR